jgi:hypothetical protein
MVDRENISAGPIRSAAVICSNTIMPMVFGFVVSSNWLGGRRGAAEWPLDAFRQAGLLTWTAWERFATQATVCRFLAMSLST